MEKSKAFADLAKTMAKIDVCMMQTVGEHGVNTRPMSNNGEVEYDGDNWFFAKSDSTKIAELAEDDRVQLTFADHDGPNFISVWGTGAVVDDVELKKKLWHEGLEQWFDNGPEHPEVALIKVTANKIQTWGDIGERVIE